MLEEWKNWLKKSGGNLEKYDEIQPCDKKAKWVVTTYLPKLKSITSPHDRNGNTPDPVASQGYDPLPNSPNAPEDDLYWDDLEE